MNKNENKKSLKKPLILGGIAVLLTLIGVAGGNTYAKYITSKNVPAQTATVAKFGFVINANTTNLFSTKYAKDGDAVSMTKNDSGLGVAAISATVAPGTSGSMTFSINGSAEVATKLSFAMTDANIKDVTMGDYQPVKWTLNDGTTNLAENTTLAKVKDKLLADGEEFAPMTTVNKTYTLSWAWAFEGTETNANVMDTLLGYASAKASYSEAMAYVGLNSDGKAYVSSDVYEAAVTTVSFDLAIKVEQVAK